MAAAPEPVPAGSQLAYTITVHNDGPAAARNVLRIDDLPDGVTLLSATSDQAACYEGSTRITDQVGDPEFGNGDHPVYCRLDNLAIGATATATVVVIPADRRVVHQSRRGRLLRAESNVSFQLNRGYPYSATSPPTPCYRSIPPTCP